MKDLPMPKTTEAKWWWQDSHIAAHFNDPDESPDGLTLRPECPRCMALAHPYRRQKVSADI